MAAHKKPVCVDAIRRAGQQGNVIFALRDLYGIRIRWQRHDDLVDLVVQRLTEDVDAKLVAHHKLIQIGNPCEYTSKNLPGL